MMSTPAQALEAALIAEPGDWAAHAAYSDWLIEQGDPLGELIQAQLALEDQHKPASERKKLLQRQKSLLQKHGYAWRLRLEAYFKDQKERHWRTEIYCEYLFARLLPFLDQLKE